MKTKIINGDALGVLRDLPSETVDCVVTSPPYYHLRDYGIDGQIGLEDTPAEYIQKLSQVFSEVRRVLKEDGTLWLNLGDTYIKRNLAGIPWRVVFALQDDGWFLRSDIVWHKPNPMPEPVTTRPARSHEFIFMLSRSERYFYDHEAIRERAVSTHNSGNGFSRAARRDQEGIGRGVKAGSDEEWLPTEFRTCRDVWTLANTNYRGAHVAVMPESIVERCIKAGSREGGLVLDCFGGAGTVGLVAQRLERDSLLIELSPEFCEASHQRIRDDNPMFSEVTIEEAPDGTV